LEGTTNSFFENVDFKMPSTLYDRSGAKGEYPVSYLIAIGASPTSAQIFSGTPPENSDGVENSAKNCVPHGEISPH
jgi:hypothetical protein